MLLLHYFVKVYLDNKVSLKLIVMTLQYLVARQTIYNPLVGSKHGEAEKVSASIFSSKLSASKEVVAHVLVLHSWTLCSCYPIMLMFKLS